MSFSLATSVGRRTSNLAFLSARVGVARMERRKEVIRREWRRVVTGNLWRRRPGRGRRRGGSVVKDCDCMLRSKHLARSEGAKATEPQSEGSQSPLFPEQVMARKEDGLGQALAL